MPNYGKIGGAGVGAAVGTWLLPGIGTKAGAAIGGLFGGLFDSNDEAPSWENIAGPGKDAYGQDIARENMSRYGFQGVYQKYLSSENTRLKDDEARRIMKIASNAAPGMATLRGGTASRGLGGSTSGVIAKEQRNAAIVKAADIGTSAYDASSNRLDTQFLTMTGQNEGWRFGASQDLMKATGMQTDSEIGVAKFNRTGSMGQQNASWGAQRETSNAWNDLFGGVAGQYAGMSMYKDLFPKGGSGGKDNPFAWDWMSKNMQFGLPGGR